MDLTEAQWQVLKPLLTPKRRPDGRGRPWRDARAVLNGILWVLRTGAPWHDLPDCYPPYQTCHRRFQQWQRDGTLTRSLHALAEDLRARGKLDGDDSTHFFLVFTGTASYLYYTTYQSTGPTTVRSPGLSLAPGLRVQTRRFTFTVTPVLPVTKYGGHRRRLRAVKP
ncbi:MAG TPA: transposase [Candidatus Acidoferrum sp.]|nr:transposase [Candidatus Acidoferrum sp.]